MTSASHNFDPIQYKNNTRLNWNTVAPKYHEDWARTYTGPFKSTIELVKLAQINQNDVVLDLEPIPKFDRIIAHYSSC